MDTSVMFKTRLGHCLAALLLLTPLRPAAFETTSSFSITKNLGRGISSNLNAGLISSSFSDMFSRVEMSSTQIELRLLEGRQRVDPDEIRRYVDERYGALTDVQRARLSENLLQARRVDEDLKVRMAAPRLADDIKLMFAQERERLRSAMFLYEQQLQAAYLPHAKPNATGELNEWMQYFDLYFRDAYECDYLGKRPTCPELPAGGSAVRHLITEKEHRTRQLLFAHTEVEGRLRCSEHCVS